MLLTVRRVLVLSLIATIGASSAVAVDGAAWLVSPELAEAAGLDIVWPQFLTVAFLGAIFFAASIALFRRSITVSK